VGGSSREADPEASGWYVIEAAGGSDLLGAGDEVVKEFDIAYAAVCGVGESSAQTFDRAEIQEE